MFNIPNIGSMGIKLLVVSLCFLVILFMKCGLNMKSSSPFEHVVEEVAEDIIEEEIGCKIVIPDNN